MVSDCSTSAYSKLNYPTNVFFKYSLGKKKYGRKDIKEKKSTFEFWIKKCFKKLRRFLKPGHICFLNE